jgi:hypothetical protein
MSSCLLLLCIGKWCLQNFTGAGRIDGRRITPDDRAIKNILLECDARDKCLLTMKDLVLLFPALNNISVQINTREASKKQTNDSLDEEEDDDDSSNIDKINSTNNDEDSSNMDSIKSIITDNSKSTNTDGINCTKMDDINRTKDDNINTATCSLELKKFVPRRSMETTT